MLPSSIYTIPAAYIKYPVEGDSYRLKRFLVRAQGTILLPTSSILGMYI